MAPRAGRRQRGPRPAPRQLLWWIWPSFPASWAEVPARLGPGATQITRLTVAAVVAYLVADVVSPGILDLTAPLTALLVVQASTVGTLLMGLVRVGAVLTGVLVAVGVATFIGLSWWSLALVIAASLILAMLFRLGDQSLETPISAMLILAAVSTPGLAAEVRVVNTLIGTVVGIAFSLVVPVAIPNRRATEAVRRVARSQAALMDEVAVTLGRRAPHPEELRAWLDWADYIGGEVDDAGRAVADVRQSRRLNPRALAAATVHPGLQAALDRLRRTLAAERALLVAMGREAPDATMTAPPRTEPDPEESELSRVFAVVLDDVADALRSFADLISAEYGSRQLDRADEALGRTLEIVRETRAVLTELMLLEADPREQTELWMLHGSVLAAIEHMLQQLDFERAERSTDPWLSRRAMPLLRSGLRPVVRRKDDD